MQDPGYHFLQDDSMGTTHFCDKELFACRCGVSNDTALLSNRSQRVSGSMFLASGQTLSHKPPHRTVDIGAATPETPVNAAL